jgi:hypothetical protein
MVAERWGRSWGCVVRYFAANHARTALVKKNPGDERRSARANVLLAATIECDGVRTRARVVNLSAHGALVSGDIPLEEDALITFECNGLTVQGWVAWVRAPHAGIQFGEPKQPGDLLRSSTTHSPVHSIMKDTRKLDFRRPGLRGNQLTAEERKILEQWAGAQRGRGH